jgi:6,7-dimethyl-8-ribityllumazine synthase
MADIKNSILMRDKGIQQVKDAFVVLVKTEWNHAIVNKLEEGCLRVLKRSGVRSTALVVPGAVEIPFAINHYWSAVKAKKRPDAFIAFGCVVRGGTPHFEYVCQSVTSGITMLNIQLPVPVIFGVLTVDNNQQAEERIGGIHGHKGEEAAITAVKMIRLCRELKKE